MTERFDIIRATCAGKVCLDVGIIGDLEHHLRDRNKWVFHHMSDVAKEVVGLDLDAGGLATVHRNGYRKVVAADAERFTLRKKFDVIVAGELIEHLGNPGLFLSRCREHLVERGVLLLTTPNTFSVNHLVRGLAFGSVQLFHEHVNAYTPALLRELLRRERFVVSETVYFTERNAGVRNLAFRALSNLRPGWAEGILTIAQVQGARE